MRKTQLVIWASCMLGAAAGCAPEDPGPTPPAGEAVTEVTRALGGIGQIGQAGMQVFFDAVATNINFANVQGLAACDSRSLYAVLPVGTSPFALYYSKDRGATFTRINRDALSAEIACDDAKLYTMDANKQISFAVRAGGNLSEWQQSTAAPLVDHIQGGDGTLYGVDDEPGLHPLYKTTTHNGSDVSWTLVSNIGSKFVTGGGSSAEPDTLAWPRRAFTTELDGTVYFSDTILEGDNSWSLLNTGNERFKVLSAATTNLLYGIDLTSGPRLVTVTLQEDGTPSSNACFDDFDNDANGMKDSEDPACVERRAIEFCARSGTLDGTYCVDRYQPAMGFLGQETNQNAGVLKCQNHQVIPPAGQTAKVPTVGACQHVGTRSDRLMNAAEIAGSDPPDTGRWCNRFFSNGDWNFSFGGTNPCGVAPFGGTIVRAGLYSITGDNNVYVSCTDGQSALSGSAGVGALASAKDAVTHALNRCLFTATATSLPVFSKPFTLEGQPTPNPFRHDYLPVLLEQFGLGETGPSSGIDRFGQDKKANHMAYDMNLVEGTRLYAMHNGTVLTPDGVRERDVGDCQTGFQGEMYVQYKIGSHTNFQESFVAYYAHHRRSLVAPGQIVREGQLIGFTGRTGCASDPHLHMGVFRTSNANAHRTSSNIDWGFGWRLHKPECGSSCFETTPGGYGDNMNSSNAIDPLGWANGSAFDPMGYVWRNEPVSTFVGVGGWSVNLFKPGEAFHHP